MDARPIPFKLNKKQTERLVGFFALLTLLIAWFAGVSRAESDVMPYLAQLYPEAARIEKLASGNYAAYAGSDEEILGYASLASANGYGGPLRLAVSSDLNGNVTGMVIVSHKETPSFLARVVSLDFFESLVGKAYTDRFSIGDDVDAISGATYTSRAIAESVRVGSASIAANDLNLAAPPPITPEITFGWREGVLIFVFLIAYLGHQSRFPYSKQVRWVSLILGMVVLGFVFNSPLTLAAINKFLLGFWPEWQTNLYWYLLLLGILYFLIVENKNLYCTWFCPFGAVQECMGALGGAKAKTAGKAQPIITWGVRIIAWGAIMLAFYFRNPSFSSYEIFGAVFNLTGTNAQFILLGLVLILAIFIKRPWCNNLCPIKPVFSLVQLLRRWLVEIWKRKITAKNH